MRPDPLTADLLANGPFVRSDAPCQCLELSGPEAGDFLQRLCTQDVLGLAEGGLRPAAFLDAKGKLLATCVVFRLGGSFWLETHREQVERLQALLHRYHFTEKLTIGAPSAGPAFETVSLSNNVAAQECRVERFDGLTVVHFARRGIQWLRSYGGPLALATLHDDGRTEPIATQPLSADLAECLRMAAGLVRVGVETEATTLALEADLADHCSTTKGCYTGQEIVARIHTYGHVNRRLCLLHLPAGPAIDSPLPLHEPEDALAVGRVLHAVPVPGRPMRVGLGYLPKDFQAVGTRLSLGDGGAVTVAGFGEPA